MEQNAALQEVNFGWMNRITTALLAALEALIVVAIGVGIALVPLTILWASHFELAVEWFVFWRAAVDIWLLGNGVDLLVQLTPETAAALGLNGAEDPFSLTFALLGFALIAVFLGLRTGRRAAEAPHRWVAVTAAIGTYALFTVLVTLSAGTSTVQPALLQAVLMPPLIYGTAVLVGSELGQVHRGAAPGDHLDPVARGIRSRYRLLPYVVRATILESLRGGTAAVSALVAVSAVTVTVLIAVNYATIISLYEAVQAGVEGGFALTLAQLAIVPNLVGWAAAWYIGPGVAVGVGTSVSPVGTLLGPIPGLPILGALPRGDLSFGFIALFVPILIGFLCGVVVRQRLGASRPAAVRAPSALQHVLIGLGMGLVAGVLLGLLAWWSGGAIGPHRLSDVGPNPLLVGGLAALEIGIAAAIGMLAGGVVALPRLDRAVSARSQPKR